MGNRIAENGENEQKKSAVQKSKVSDFSPHFYLTKRGPRLNRPQSPVFITYNPRLCRLKMVKFVGKVVLSERSEFTTFPLSKFHHFQETRQNRGVFLCYFLCTSKESKS